MNVNIEYVYQAAKNGLNLRLNREDIQPFAFTPENNGGVISGMPNGTNIWYAGYLGFQTGTSFSVISKNVKVLLDTGLNSNANIPIFFQSVEDINADKNALQTPYFFVGFRLNAQ